MFVTGEEIIVMNVYRRWKGGMGMEATRPQQCATTLIVFLRLASEGVPIKNVVSWE
jgi:hypothetical protein